MTAARGVVAQAGSEAVALTSGPYTVLAVPWMTSGATYWGVPHTVLMASALCLARPKSAILTCVAIWGTTSLVQDAAVQDAKLSVVKCCKHTQFMRVFTHQDRQASGQQTRRVHVQVPCKACAACT
jgi:hypothetical protein